MCVCVCQEAVVDMDGRGVRRRRMTRSATSGQTESERRLVVLYWGDRVLGSIHPHVVHRPFHWGPTMSTPLLWHRWLASWTAVPDKISPT